MVTHDDFEQLLAQAERQIRRAAAKALARLDAHDAQLAAIEARLDELEREVESYTDFESVATEETLH